MSFIVPAHNEQELIRTCLESIKHAIHESGVSAEIIVVDNASTDRTAVIASSIPGVQVISEPKKGLSRARQAGYLASSGELIANVDSDNWLPEGWIEKALSEFEKRPELVMLTGPLWYYDLPSITNWFVYIFFYGAGYIGYHLSRILSGKGILTQGGNFIIRRSALNEIGGYNVAFDFYGEDIDVGTRLQKVGRIIWTFKFPMNSSGRRIAEEGIFRMAFVYGMNFLWTTFLHRPFTLNEKPIRRALPEKWKKRFEKLAELR